jgi:hypothetical protein
MAIGPDKWGVHGWKFIHHIALGYPNTPSNNDKTNYKHFFNLLGNVLPCSICSNHYNEHLLIYPLTDEVLSNKLNLINWTIDMHNEVNKQNGKKIYSYNEALLLIKNNYENNNKELYKNNIKEHYNNISNDISNNVSNEITSNEIPIKKSYNYILLYITVIICIIIIFLLFIKK